MKIYINYNSTYIEDLTHTTQQKQALYGFYNLFGLGSWRLRFVQVVLYRK